jgi:hypothetical protein
MRHSRFLAILVSLLVILTCGASKTYLPSSGDSQMVFRIHQNSRVSVDLLIQNPYYAVFPRQKASTLLVALLPFEANDDCSITSPSDISVAFQNKGVSYSIVTLLTPVTIEKIHLTLEDCIDLKEADDDKAILQLEFFPDFLSGAERDLFSTFDAISIWDVKFVFPEEYDDKEVNMSTAEIIKLDKTTYQLPASTQNVGKYKEIWIVFPNPQEKNFLYGKLILLFAFGLVTSYFQLIPIKKRQFSRALMMFISSFLLLLIIGYYSLVLVKKLEYLVFASAILPHAITGLITSIYIYIANKRQAIVSGIVKIEGQSAQYANVELIGIENENEIVISKIDHQNEGRYEFHTWIKNSKYDYKVIAYGNNVQKIESDVFSLAIGDKRDLRVLDLQRIIPANDDQAPQN